MNSLEPFIMHFAMHLDHAVDYIFHVCMGFTMFTADRQIAQ